MLLVTADNIRWLTKIHLSKIFILAIFNTKQSVLYQHILNLTRHLAQRLRIRVLKNNWSEIVNIFIAKRKCTFLITMTNKHHNQSRDIPNGLPSIFNFYHQILKYWIQICWVKQTSVWFYYSDLWTTYVENIYTTSCCILPRPILFI